MLSREALARVLTSFEAVPQVFRDGFLRRDPVPADLARPQFALSRQETEMLDAESTYRCRLGERD